MEYPRSLIILVILQMIQSLSLLGFGLYRLLITPSFSLFINGQKELYSFSQEFFQDVIGLGITTLGSLLMGGGLLILTIAMLRRRKWSWILSMMLQGILLAVLLLAYIQHQPSFALMFLAVILVFYLNDGEVQAFLDASRTE